MDQEASYRIMIYSWLIASFWGAIVQIFFQQRFAAKTVWGLNTGWQREIGFWNIGMCMVLISVLSSGYSVSLLVVPAVLTLSFLFGANHLFAALSHPRAHGNWIGFALNLITVLWCGTLYVLK